MFAVFFMIVDLVSAILFGVVMADAINTRYADWLPAWVAYSVTIYVTARAFLSLIYGDHMNVIFDHPRLAQLASKSDDDPELNGAAPVVHSRN